MRRTGSSVSSYLNFIVCYMYISRVSATFTPSNIYAEYKTILIRSVTADVNLVAGNFHIFNISAEFDTVYSEVFIIIFTCIRIDADRIVSNCNVC